MIILIFQDILEIFAFMWNPESWALESGMQLKEFGIPLTTEIQNPCYTDKDWNPVPRIRNPRRGIQNPRLSWIALHGAIHLEINLCTLSDTVTNRIENMIEETCTLSLSRFCCYGCCLSWRLEQLFTWLWKTWVCRTLSCQFWRVVCRFFIGLEIWGGGGMHSPENFWEVKGLLSKTLTPFQTLA